ncbi:glycosyltransferase family 2 protein [Aureimonas sp. AU20]|uniref:glycosyltransferase family 2 protein n=1 Tax=Aureimonas sp. AU20 TaxID=1349819 RepID=UPI0007228932|nr:glycosyltransferase family 2 protein [Aureimonas sp. AU20]ALN74511.1 hypothetical protein M673_17410 [Aureimonas sp. AU20]
MHAQAWAGGADTILVSAFLLSQILYALSLGLGLFFLRLPVDWVDPREAQGRRPEEHPYIVLFYPVLRELESTMRTTFLSLARIDYPASRYRVVAIPNANDTATVESLRRLAQEFAFLQIVEVPATSDPSWQVVWDSWNANPKAYWWHKGKRAGVSALPPKKTRQLIYAFYTLAEDMAGGEDFLVNYIDADSCPPPDHFLAASAGMRHYDVLQAQNIAGNLLTSISASWHAFDHMAWDGFLYPHLSAGGRQPYWVLGKGLFFRASDLVALGGFHPWITIEDPEVGMRFWANGKRIGIIENPLIEEVPSTLGHGITQRKRWVCGFFQSLAQPLKDMGMTPWQRLRARLNFGPCLSLSAHAIGLPMGLWALAAWSAGDSPVPPWTLGLAVVNLAVFALTLGAIYRSVWQRAALILPERADRLRYLLRVNPASLVVWWLLWLIPLAIGFWMFLRDRGLVWERTVKIDANHELVRAVSGSQPAVVRLGVDLAPPAPANRNRIVEAEAPVPGIAL